MCFGFQQSLFENSNLFGIAMNMLNGHSFLDRDMVNLNPPTDGVDLNVQKALLAFILRTRTMRLLIKQLELFVQRMALVLHEFQEVILMCFYFTLLAIHMLEVRHFMLQ